jgi:hypothetical protein
MDHCLEPHTATWVHRGPLVFVVTEGRRSYSLSRSALLVFFPDLRDTSDRSSCVGRYYGLYFGCSLLRIDFAGRQHLLSRERTLPSCSVFNAVKGCAVIQVLMCHFRGTRFSPVSLYYKVPYSVDALGTGL